MSTIIKRSFSGGEVTPSLYARVDTVKYSTGLRTCRNSYVLRHGGTANRPGSRFISEVKDSSLEVKLVPFVFNNEQTYVLEFGHKYMRVIKDGSLLTETGTTITGVTQANPAVITVTAHGYTTGDEVAISSVVGMTELNGRNFKITVLSVNTFSIQDMGGTNIDSSSYTAYSSGGTSSKIYEISTLYSGSELSSLQYIQSADIITLTHTNHYITSLSRTADTTWTLSKFDSKAVVKSPKISAVSGGSGSIDHTYYVTAFSFETGEESLPIEEIKYSKVAATTSATHTVTYVINGDESDGYNIYLKLGEDLPGFIGTTTSTTSFVYDGVVKPDTTDSYPTARTPLDGNIYVKELQEPDRIIGTAYAENPCRIALARPGTHKTGDRVYMSGLITNMTQLNDRAFTITFLSITQFTLDGEDATPYTTVGSEGVAWLASDFPSNAAYYQQRLFFAGATGAPETVHASRIGQFNNFSKSSPLRDDDRLSFSLSGKSVNTVNHMVDIGKLVMFTSGGEWAAEGGSGGVLTPSQINAKQYTYNGIGDVPPLVVGGNALYLQSRGSIIRDLGYDFSSDGYKGNDLTIFSAHLFDGFSVVDWAYQQIPHSIVWAVRSDGILLGLTYVREQEMLAWHRHDFDGGLVKKVATIPEGSEDVVYVTVERTVKGRTVTYIERLSSRFVNEKDVRDTVFCDSHLSYDGRNTGATTMTLSTGSGWLYTDDLTLTASASYFVSSDVGNAIHFPIVNSKGVTTDILRCTIKSYTSNTVVTVNPHKTVQSSLQNTATTSWEKAVDLVSGLWHIEGKEVSVQGDGFVVSSPFNGSYDTFTVSNGSVTLDRPYSVIHVGLPYISDLETLDVDTADGETISDKNKIVGKVNVFVEKSRGIFAGSKAPTDDSVDALDGLREVKQRNKESQEFPVALETGIMEVNIRPEWNSNGRVFIRQVDPIPLSVLAIAPSGKFPFKG